MADEPRSNDGLATAAERAGALAAAHIRVDRLAYTYEDGSVALQGVSLVIPPGQFMVLAGPNGSGKTTLTKHFNGLLKPSAGQVFVAGGDTRPLRVAQLARTVGYVFQNPDHQIFAGTVREEIAFGLRLQGLAAAEVERRTDAALALVGLQDVDTLPPATLSLGQRKLVTLAAVLAVQPAILVLDEPTGGLDWRSRQELMERVAVFNAEGGTVVLITHDVRLIAEYARRVVVLRSGTIAFDGSPDALFTNRTILAHARLTVPPVVRVAQRLADLSGAAVLSGIRHAAELADVY
jgi:energy-coupling factor transport system ATP-binding protein